MDRYQFIIALLTALPGLLTAIAAFWHSVNTRQVLAALTKPEDPVLLAMRMKAKAQ